MLAENREIMKKILGLIIAFTFLSGCVESMALLGPVTSGAGSGKIAQSAVSSAMSYGIKKQTGKSPMEHAIAYAEKHNPEKKKTNCVVFLKSTESEICEAVKKNIVETKEYFKNKNKIIIRSKIEDLAKKSSIYNRR
tara:strand:- start:340 stop:750 length:411 start_codon:yes stop_codon:yes gene_type:complete